MLLDSNSDWALETKRMIDLEGGTSEIIQADATDEDSVREAVARAVKLFGAVHILINIGSLAYISLYNTLGLIAGSWRHECKRRCHDC